MARKPKTGATSKARPRSDRKATKVAKRGRPHPQQTISKPEAPHSVVNAKYRQRYEDGRSCGDELATRLRRHVEAADGTIDVAKLKALAELNGIWEERYERLNAGLARMTCGNRLRALVRKGGKINWGRQQ